MSTIYTLRDFGTTKPPTVEKVYRDGMLMHTESRYIIILNEEGTVVEKIDRKDDKHIGNFLCVLVPVVYNGTKIDFSVALEIGLSRSVPYKQFEKWFAGGKVAVKGRRPVVQLTDSTILSLMPHISLALKSIACHYVNTTGWKSVTFSGKGKDLKSKTIRWKSGIFATINEDEELLCYAVFVSDLRERSIYLSKKALFISYWLRRFKFNYYTRKQLLSYKGVAKIFEMLRNAKYPAHHLDIVLHHLSARERNLLELGIRAHISVNEDDWNNNLQKELPEMLEASPPPSLYQDLHSRFHSHKEAIEQVWHSENHVWPKRDAIRANHANGCLRFEIVLDEHDRSHFLAERIIS